MKNILILLLTSILLFSCQINKEDTNLFNNNWKFIRTDKTNSNSKESMLPLDENLIWEDVTLPHTAKIESALSNDMWQGLCWYKKEFKIPHFSKNKKYYLKFEAAMNYASVWINDKHLTNHQGGFLPFVIDISKYINKGKNTVILRLDNTDNPVTGPKPLKILDFSTYGGLYRNAWLITKNKVHITDPILANTTAGGGVFITTSKVSSEESIINVQTNVINESDTPKDIKLLHTLYYNGEKIEDIKSKSFLLNSSENYNFQDTIKVKSANLWSPDSPNLYKLVTSVYDDNGKIDSQENNFGIRRFEFKNHKLFINNKETYLRGVNRHQEYPYIGYALSDNAQYRDAMKIKKAGFNFIRLSHYPQSPSFLAACDELGIVVLDDILGWQYYAETEAFKNYCYTSAHNLIRRDRNHPCVLAWEVSLNETPMPLSFMKKMNKIVHEEYPGQYVYSCGWQYPAYDIYLQARQHRIIIPEDMNFDKPYIVSEYGDWEYYSNDAGFNQQNNLRNTIETSSRQSREYGEKRMLQQVHNVQEAYNDNLSIPAAGDGYWVMYDYKRGYDELIEESGLMDLFRVPKFAYYFYQSQQNIIDSTNTILFISSYWNERSSTDVKVFSNCDKVSLYLNNKLVATQLPDKNSISNNLPHPPFTFNIPKFQKGTLKAIGYVNTTEVKSTEVSTPEKPTALRCRLDISGRAPEAGCKDAIFLYVEAVDKNGSICPDYTSELKVKVNNKVRVINTDKIETKAGIASILLEIRSQTGKADVEVMSSDGLKGNLSFDIE